MMPAWRGQMLPVLVGLFALVLPLVLTEGQLTIYVLAGLAMIVVTGLWLVIGFGGPVSLGQAAFYAIGAYTAGLLSVHGVSPVIGLIAAPIVAALVGLVVGVPLLRLEGHYLSFATLAFQVILLTLISQVRGLTGGEAGIRNIPPLGIGDLHLDGPRQYAYVTVLVLAVVMLVSHRIIHSRPGRGLRAMGSNPIGAAAVGVPVGTYKLQMFALSAAYAGVAGAIYAFFLNYVSPLSFPVLLSIQLLVMTVVGGRSELWGPVVGVLLVTLIQQLLVGLAGRPGMPVYAPAMLSYAVYALSLMAVMVLAPQGLVPALRRRFGRERVKRPSQLATQVSNP